MLGHVNSVYDSLYQVTSAYQVRSLLVLLSQVTLSSFGKLD